MQLLWGKVFGQERNLTTAAIARMNLFLHGVEDFEVVRGDTLRDPAFFTGDELATFDCVIANPPFSLEEMGRRGLVRRTASGATSPECRRARAATTPGSSTWSSRWRQGRAGWPWSCRKARCSAAAPKPRFGGNSSKQTLSRRSSAWRPTCSTEPVWPPASWSSASESRPTAREGPRRRRLQACSSAAATRTPSKTSTGERIQELYASFADEEGFAHVASLDEIAGNDFDLNISRYVAAADEEDLPTLAEATAQLKAALEDAYVAEDRLLELLKAEGLVGAEEVTAT